MLTCTHASRPPFTLTWFRETTAIRQDNAETLNECGCQVPDVQPGSSNNRTVTFMDFAREFAGEYSCRAPINATTSTFDICRFDILVAGELIIQCVCPFMPPLLLLLLLLLLRASVSIISSC